jgi:DNA-binding transcriptional LysR family regulator
MNVGLRQLRAFLAVAKCGSFGRAAEEVAVSQSAISFAVQRLENELGLRLLDRTTRQVRVTAVGETLAASATRLLTELDPVLRELKDTGQQRRGRVVIGLRSVGGARSRAWMRRTLRKGMARDVLCNRRCRTGRRKANSLLHAASR